MSTISWPAALQAPTTVTWGVKANTQIMVSPLNGTVQTLELPGARWAVQMAFPAMAEAEAGPFQAYVMKLRGQANRAALYNHARNIPRGTAGGTPLVNGGSQTGASLITDGWSAGATLLQGDFFSVNGELKMATADCTADGSGNMTITFEPPLRASPANNAALTTTKPTALFILQEPETRWTTRPGKYTNIDLAFVEAFV
jgi:hypothetical protein